jgi:hypothetical protein
MSVSTFLSRLLPTSSGQPFIVLAEINKARYLDISTPAETFIEDGMSPLRRQYRGPCYLEDRRGILDSLQRTNARNISVCSFMELMGSDGESWTSSTLWIDPSNPDSALIARLVNELPIKKD